MDAFTAIATLLIGLLLLGAGAAVFGTDSRDSIGDDHVLKTHPLS